MFYVPKYRKYSKYINIVIIYIYKYSKFEILLF